MKKKRLHGFQASVSVRSVSSPHFRRLSIKIHPLGIRTQHSKETGNSEFNLP